MRDNLAASPHVSGSPGRMVKQFAVLAAAALTFILGQNGHAQDRESGRADVFKESVRHAARRTDAASNLRTRRQGDRRIDAVSGVTRAVYRAKEPARRHFSAESAAREALADYSDEFGLSGSGELRLESVRSTSVSHHVTLRQYVAGLPVYRRVVKVNLNDTFEPTIIFNGLAPGLARVDLNTIPSLSASDARRIAVSTLTKGGAQTSEAELEIFPLQAPVLVWRLIMWPDSVPGEWEMLVDAHSGEVVQLLDLASHRTPEATRGHYVRPALGPDAGATLATGTGYVFDPDPLTTSGAPYGPPYVDGTDTDTAVLNDERKLVDLLEISVDNDGNYRLTGPYVQIVGGGSLDPPYQPPALASAEDFRFTRGEDHFEAVNAYYHLDKSQRYVQSLGFLDRQSKPVRVNPRAFASDNSFYTPSQNIIEFGIGGVDDAEDAGVLWHEYAHALLESGAPGLNAGGEGQALHEGWADYWAGSYMRFLAESQVGKRSDWENVFRWDSGDGQIWPGRQLTLAGKYKIDTTCEDAGDSAGDGCDIYKDGLLWATSLMELYTDLGRPVIDRLVIQSHSYLAHPVTFADAAEAILQADRDLNGGIHTASIVDRLSAREYLGLVGPIISHTPLPASEDLGGSVRIDVDAVPGAAEITSVALQYKLVGEPEFVEKPLTLQSGSRYSADLTLPSVPDTIVYFVEAVDANSIVTRLPSSMGDYFSIAVGPDSEPPTISHIPISRASSALWPAEVVASVNDNLGVDTVWVDFSVEDGTGTVYDSGSFGLASSGSVYRGSFTTPVSMLLPASTVRYSLTARDAAVAANTSNDPASGLHSFPIVFSGLLQQWDLEVTDGNFQATGVWEYGSPTYAMRTAHSGDRVWGSNLEGAYPDSVSISSLELPAINLEGLFSAYLIFWHWYDFEYRGVAEPGTLVRGNFWDGGNVKVSTGNRPFQVVEPDGGYPWFIDSGSSNPLGGETAFGAYSFGWRRAIIPLPTVRDVRIRFDLGADDSNLEQSVAFAGWYLDDITITTDRPSDSTIPTVLSAPANLNLQPVGQPMPGFALRASDETGIGSVYVDYSFRGESASSGSFPLAMSFTDLTSFAGTIPTDPSLSSGDRFEYRFRVADFDGNEVVFPTPPEDPLVIEYRTVRTVSILQNVVATGQWTQQGSVWVARAGGEEQAPVSSLVLPPTTLPSNASDVWLVLQHSFELGGGLGGNVALSADDGKNWAVLAPVDGYPARFADASHPMNGQDVFSGESEGLVTTFFDVSSFAGQEVRFRFDFGANRTPEATERWSIGAAAIQASSVEPEIEIPIELTLNANFPDPFSSTTTINYTIPEQAVVRLDVYNVLGQLVALVTNRVHEPGTYTTTFDGSPLPSGVYFLRLDVDGVRKVERMVIAH